MATWNTHDDADLDRLARQAQVGDPAALDDLLALLRPLIVGRKFLPYNDDAEEAAQEALLTIATKLRTWAGAGPVRGRVVAMSSNRPRSAYRSMRRRAVENHAQPPSRPAAQPPSRPAAQPPSRPATRVFLRAALEPR